MERHACKHCGKTAMCTKDDAQFTCQKCKGVTFIKSPIERARGERAKRLNDGIRSGSLAAIATGLDFTKYKTKNKVATKRVPGRRPKFKRVDPGYCCGSPLVNDKCRICGSAY